MELYYLIVVLDKTQSNEKTEREAQGPNEAQRTTSCVMVLNAPVFN